MDSELQLYAALTRRPALIQA